MGVQIWILAALCCVVVVSSEKNVVCYYGTWVTYRTGNGKFAVEDIDPFLCSHLIYTFVGIDAKGTVLSLDSYLDYDIGNFEKFNALKQQNPALKTLLAVGGWNEGSYKYSIMAADATLRKNFIDTALNMTLSYGFDGFDVDWEYPARRDTAYGYADIDNFSTLLKELREAFDTYGLLLTAAVSSVAQTASLSYDIPVISKYLDYVHLMTYDMYGAWDTVTGHNAPLHKGENFESVPEAEIYAVDAAIQYWLSEGCPPEKLVLGVPFYGRTFTLANASDNGVRAKVTGAGIAGPYTAEAGIIGYNEFCEMRLNQTWEIKFDELARVPYAVQDVNWVSFDNATSLTEKIQWASQYNLTNVMMWSIETDDFHGLCGETNPLLKALNAAIGRDVDSLVSSTTAVETETPIVVASTVHTVDSTSTTATTNVTIEQENICKHEGVAANPNDCHSFLMCIKDATGQLYHVLFKCPANLMFNPAISGCDYAFKVNCS